MSGTEEMSEMDVTDWQNGSRKFCIASKNTYVSSPLLAEQNSGSVTFLLSVS